MSGKAGRYRCETPCLSLCVLRPQKLRQEVRRLSCVCKLEIRPGLAKALPQRAQALRPLDFALRVSKDLYAAIAADSNSLPALQSMPQLNIGGCHHDDDLSAICCACDAALRVVHFAIADAALDVLQVYFAEY